MAVPADARGRARARRESAARTLARDPAAWAWLVVALFAVLPLRAALDVRSTTPRGESPRVEAPAPAPLAERPAGPPQG